MKFKVDNYVVTNKGKLGKIILPGSIDHEQKIYKPVSVQLNTKVYQIWQENLIPVEYVALEIMGDSSITILKAHTAFNLIKVLLKNRIRIKIDIEETKECNIFWEKELPEYLNRMY